MGAERPSWLQRAQERVAAFRYLTFSLLVHLLILVLGGSAVIVHRLSEPQFESEAPGGLVGEEEAELKPPSQPISQALVAPAVTITPPGPPLPDVITVNQPALKFQMPLPAAKGKGPVTSEPRALPSALGAVPGLGGLPVTMAGRAGGTARAAALKKNGGKDRSELAVLNGLRWLKRTQRPDGSWSPSFAPAMTGLAVLCFLGHGELPESMEFGSTVQKGIEWLAKEGKAHGGNLAGSSAESSKTAVYEHAIGTYALGEYFTMTRDAAVKEVLTSAVAEIVSGQAPDGGWQYYYEKQGNSDTSVSGWQIQALKAAHLTGLNLAGVDAALDRAMVNLQRVQGPRGGFGYLEREDSYSLTGVGVLCATVWRGEKDPLAQRGIKFLMEKTEREFPVDYKSKGANLYGWYYDTQACLMTGGMVWSKWNFWFQDAIANAQRPDGSWPPTGNPIPLGPENDPGPVGTTYRTTLCVLMLEVYYRYMPTTR